MKFGLTQDQYTYILNEVVLPLENKGAEVWCFGSRARNTHELFSDLDLMVVADISLKTLISNLKEKLTNSNFPFKVDIVEYSDFAESYKQNFAAEKLLYR